MALKKRKIVGLAALAVLAVGAGVYNAVIAANYNNIAEANATTTNVTYTRNDTLREGVTANTEIQEEGSVLLVNKDIDSNGTKMLPLGSRKVSVLGTYSHNYVQGGTGSAGGKDDAGTVMFDDAMYTAGIDYNEKCWEWLDKALGKGNNVHNGGIDATQMTAEDAAKLERADFTSYSTINEFSKATYEQFAKPTLSGYDDTAIVTFARSGAEGASPSLDYDGNQDTTTGRVYLELTDDEKDLLSFCKANFQHTVVLINSAEPMECGFVNSSDYNVDALVWMGHPGEAGVTGVMNLLAGKKNFSGRVVDTWTYDMTTNPTFYSANDQTYANDQFVESAHSKYYEYNEGVYVGYRYYETADAAGYFDSESFKNTKFKGNLSEGKYFSDISKNGDYAAQKVAGPQATYSGYDEVVQFPFGYGLSYTTFEKTIKSSDVKLSTHGQNSITVTVKNTGSVAGKEVVEIYRETPYNQDSSLGISGVGLETPKVELVGFAKTSELQPGGSEDVTVSFSTDEMATFDEFGAGCYVLPKGDYNFYVADNAHSWKDSKCQKVTANVAATVKFNDAGAGAKEVTINGRTVKEGKAAVNAMNDITAGDGAMLVNGGSSGNYTYGYLSRKDFAAGMKEIMSYQSNDYTGKYSGNGYVWSADGTGKEALAHGKRYEKMSGGGWGGQATASEVTARVAQDAVMEQLNFKPTEEVNGVKNAVNGKDYNYSSILASGIKFGDGNTHKTLYGYGNDASQIEATTRDGKAATDDYYKTSDLGVEIKCDQTYYVALKGSDVTDVNNNLNPVLDSDGYVKIYFDKDSAAKEGTATKLQCIHLAGVPDDDPRWDYLTNECSFHSKDVLYGDHAWREQNIDEVGKVYCNASDGPGEAGNAQKNDNTWWNCAVIIAATWNPECGKAYGVAYGHQDILNGTRYAYAPAMNTHRTPFGGRDFEYYSEDGFIAGIIGGSAVEGLQSTGMHVYIKHMALNDSDTNRGGVCTWANESSIRSIYSKPYEIACKFYKADGIMGSLNSMGMAWGHTGYYQDMVRDEWKWQGMLITDGDGTSGDAYNNYATWLFCNEGGQLATTTLSTNNTFCTTAQDGSNANNYQKYMLHKCARHALYQYSHNLDKFYNESTSTPNYSVPTTMFVVGDIIFGVAIVAAAIVAFIPGKKEN